MLRFVCRRALMAIPVVLGAATLSFFALHLIPGDAVTALLAQTPAGGDEAVRDALREQLGLDDPLPVQFAHYLGGAATGDLGESVQQRKPVTTVIGEQLPYTLQLTASATVLTLVLGVAAGLVASLSRRRWVDRIVSLISTVALSLPSFLVGVALILYFSFQLGWFPAFGDTSWKTLVLPSLALALPYAAILMALIRNGMVAQRTQQHILTARAKGLSPWVIGTRHAMRNGLIPPITVLGSIIGNLLGGAVVMEVIFSRRGIGRIAVDAIYYKDVPVVQGIVLLSAVFYVAINIVVDVAYAAADPRVRDSLIAA